MRKFLLIVNLSLLTLLTLSFLPVKDVVHVKNKVFEVSYSQKLEQPLWLIYHSTNRPTTVNRGSMDFYTEKVIHTSDAADYATNLYDKGHLAPAAAFSDNMENLKQTFSYLNCALQNQYLNRGEWRILEDQVRKWDDTEPITVKIILDYSIKSVKLPTGATVPDGFHMFITWDKSKKTECYYFANEKPTTKWEQHKSLTCKH